MNFKHSKNLQPGGDVAHKIYTMNWSPNLLRLAVAQSSDRKIVLFDENGNKKETFSTKPFKGSKSYSIKEIAFSACSTKLAVAQSDNMVFIYNLGAKWGDRKTICNKLEQESQISCMTWPITKLNEIYIGLVNGKVKVGLLKTNSSQNLYSTDSLVVSISTSLDGKHVISGHHDGIIYKYNFENSNLQKLVVHSSIPYCLSWGNDILAAGNDYKVSFYNDVGTKLQTFDYTQDEKLKEFTLSKCNNNGDCIAVGNYNKFFIFMYNKRKQVWEEACIKSLEGLYSVTAMTWKPDGSSLVTGNLTGSVDLFEAFITKKKFKEKFEITYVTHSQIIIKNLETSKRLIFKPKHSQEIVGMKIYKDNFIVITTRESIILGDIENEKQSEIVWNINGKEKYDFSNPNVCMIYAAGELTLIEYGNDEILGYCKTEYIHTDLISARLHYNNQSLNKNSTIKVISYLIDLNTIYIQDLVTQSLIGTITHEEKIDFLELNKNGNKLVYRDRKKQLYLYHIFDDKKSTLLNYCGFVKWVPNSEVLVAQDLKNMCIWYNVDDPNKVKITPIKGEITEISRKIGKTEVLVNEGINTQIYLLDDGLISFSTAIDENDLDKAVRILESLEMTTDTETHWKTLAKHSINNKRLIIAQRCYAAIGSYSKANYIKKVMKVADEKGIDHPLVEAKLLILDKQFNNAENLLLQNSLLDEAMDILNELQKWDESVKIAEKYSHPSIKEIKNQYYTWLIENDQLDKAAVIKESEGDQNAAIKHYIQGGYPAKAANLVKSYGIQSFDSSILENIVKGLLHVGIYEKAGELLELMGHYKRSLESYQKGSCYAKAVELAKKNMPNMVEKLEEEWGDYLSSQKHNEAAIIHYMEANCKDKAIEAAILARKWEKAIDLANNTPYEISKPYFADIGDHYAALHKMDLAEKYYLKSDEPILCLSMYIRYSKWEKAEQLARKHLTSEHHKDIIAKEAEKFETNGKYKEAEKLYIIAEEYDVAITMYKDAKQYDNMLRLVAKYRPDFLSDTHLMVANLIVNEPNSNLKQAELHYLEANSWAQCAEMYKNHELWEDALRIAKSYGSRDEVTLLVKIWVKDLPIEQQKKKLLSMGMIDALIDIEIMNNDFNEAFKLAEAHSKYKLPEIHLKYAMKLEDEKRHHEAEEHFIKADQVNEVIKMYEHILDFNSALRVARQHLPDTIFSIYLSQGKYLIDKGDLQRAEMCFVNAKKPNVMTKYYIDNKMLEEAEKFARKHDPSMVDIISKMREMDTPIDKMSGPDILIEVDKKINSFNYSTAIDFLLMLNTNHFNSIEKLTELWEKAISLALEYERSKATDVILYVADKLKATGNFKNAALKYESIGQIEEAVVCYLEARQLDPAQKLISSLKPGKLKDNLEKQFMIKSKETDGPNPSVDIEGLEMLFDRGDNDKCLSFAMKHSDEVFNKYLNKIVQKFIMDKNYIVAAEYLEKYETPIYKYNLELYKELAEEILAEENIDELRALKNMLFCCLKHLVNYQEFTNEMKYLARLHKIAYYQFLKSSMKSSPQNFKYSFYFVCMCILSYGDIVKFDLALLDAGMVAREKNYKGVAFILFNRYLDIYEVIQDPSIKLQWEKELDDTELPQEEPFKSEVNILSGKEKDELQTWVVKTSVDKSIDFTLPKKECPKCHKHIYEFNTVCNSCSYNYDQCIVTGYPINTQSETISCSNCNKKALKDAWKEWISNKETCPWCSSIQISYK